MLKCSFRLFIVIFISLVMVQCQENQMTEYPDPNQEPPLLKEEIDRSFVILDIE